MMVRELAIDTVRRGRHDVAAAAPEDVQAVWDRIENEYADLLYDLYDLQSAYEEGVPW